MDKVKTIIIIYENGDKQFFNNYRATAASPNLTKEEMKKRIDKRIDKKLDKKGKGQALGDDVAMGYEEAKAIHDAKPQNYTELKSLYEKFYYD